MLKNLQVRCSLWVLLFLLLASRLNAQAPDCVGNNGIIFVGDLNANFSYIADLYGWDPGQPIIPGVNPSLNAISMPGTYRGLTVTENISGPGPNITYYITDQDNYFYWDGNAWINTGHTIGSPNAVNICGGGGFIYSVNGTGGPWPSTQGDIFKYDGSGNATLLINVPDWNGAGPYDLATDCKGNFYLLRVRAPAWLRKYSPSGILLQQWTVNTAYGVDMGGGIAIVNDTLYYDNGMRLFKGSMNTGNVINITQFSTLDDLGVLSADWGSCPTGRYYHSGGNDTTVSVYRGCSAAAINFFRPAAIDRPYTFKLDFSGTAVNGTDYQYLADSLTIPANEYETSLELDPLLADPPTGLKQAIIRVMGRPCDNIGPDEVLRTITVNIYDSLPAAIITPPDTICAHTEFAIEAVVDPGLLYEWQPVLAIPDPYGLTIHPKPANTTTYTLKVTQPGAPATCPPRILTYKLEVEQYPVILLPEKEITFCENDSISIQGFVQDSETPVVFAWRPPDYLRDTTSFNNKFAGPVGDYIKKFTATTLGASCSSTDSMQIHILPSFEIDYVSPQDTLIRYGDAIELTSESEAVMWVWTPGKYLSDRLLQSPISKPEEPITYTLLAFNEYGCKDTAEVRIRLLYDNRVDIPNAFSPNNDGLNDVFKIYNYGNAKLLELRVYNRYGQMVFETTNPERGWDGSFNGRHCDVDVYHYYIQMSFPDTTEKVFKGDVTLLR